MSWFQNLCIKIFNLATNNDIPNPEEQLVNACYQVNIELIKKILEENPNLNVLTVKNWNNYSLLRIAFGSGSFELIQYLLELGFNPNEPLPKPNDLHLMLLITASKNRVQISKLMLKHGVDLATPCTHPGTLAQTTLLEAIRFFSDEYAKELESLQVELR